MAVWNWAVDGTTWADATPQVVYAGRCRVHAIDIEPNGSQSAACFIRLYDGSATTPGTTDADWIAKLNTVANEGLKRKKKVVIPNGGALFVTGCEIHAATGAENATAPTTTIIPQNINVYYTPLA